MKIDTIETIISGKLLDALMDYVDGKEELISTFNYVMDKFVEKLIWDNDNLRRYNNWFFFNINNTIEDTRLDGQEIGERLEALQDLSLIHIRDTYYDGTLQIKIDLEMIKAIYKMHIAKSNRDE